MISSDTLITAPPEAKGQQKFRHYGVFGIKPMYRPVLSETVGTLAEAAVSAHKPAIRVLDRAYGVWSSLRDYDTVISIEPSFAAFFKPLDTAWLRPPSIATRYADAAQELRDLLSSVSLDTLARMCGVSDTGYRNWLRGKGIREKQLRRLLANRALVRALVLQRGQAAANDWMQRPHPELGAQSPIDVISSDRLEGVLPLALQWASPPRRRSIIPSVEETGEGLDAHEAAAERQLTPIEVYTVY